MKHLGDITKISGYTAPVVDVITGGSPCQDLSVAGKREGLSGERSGLFMEQIRIVKEMRERDRATGRTAWAVRPRYMVWENVPGAFSSNSGKDFQAVLTEIVKIAEPDAPDVPMPVRGGWTKSGCLYSDVGQWSVAWRVHDAQFWGVPQRRKRIALVADFGGLSAPEILFERKGMSRDFEPGEASGEGTAGAVGGGVEGSICTLTGDHESRVTDYTAPVLPFDTTQITSKENGSNPQYGDPCHPLAAGGHPPAVAIGNGQINQITISEQANTLDTMHDQQAVLIAAVDCRNGTENPDINGTLQAKSSGGSSLNLQNVCRVGYAVRRLMPVECERLQGFPDGWTDIGEWTDSKGKRRESSDSARYKALGNSIALPFWQWMARRICAQYERTVTMASLFDGIGGFPLVFQRCGAVPVWASEIEEFPMAVTKRRFLEDGGI